MPIWGARSGEGKEGKETEEGESMGESKFTEQKTSPLQKFLLGCPRKLVKG